MPRSERQPTNTLRGKCLQNADRKNYIIMASVKAYSTKKGSFYRTYYRDQAGVLRSKSGFSGKRAAAAWGKEQEVKSGKGRATVTGANKVTVEEIGKQWVNNLPHLKPSTLNLYKNIWEKNIKPQWGLRRVADIDHVEIQNWITHMGKSGSWVRDVHSITSQIFDLAVKSNIIEVNPAKGVKLPRKGKGVKVYWTIDQLKAFAAECGEREDLIMLLGTSGLRWGEAIALRPKDIDFENNRIRITRNAVKVGNEMVLGTPKSHESRTVAVAQGVMDKLRCRAARIPSDSLMWRGERGGWLRSPGHRSWFDGAMNRAIGEDPTMERISPHGLRHVAAGLLANAGASILVVSLQLGHSSPAITLKHYVELFEDRLGEVQAVLDANLQA